MELIRRKNAKFDPVKFKDLYQEGLKEIIQAKMEKRAPHVSEDAPIPGKVVNIMDALRKSLAQSGKSGGPSEKSSTRRTPKKTAKKAAKKKAA